MVVCAALCFMLLAVKSRKSQDIPALAAFTVLSSGRVSIKVSGDVLHPGIYEVPANSLAISVIKMAVPLHPLKQSLANSAARPLKDGSAVALALQPDGSSLLTTGQMSVSERLVLGIPLDIAAMSEADFDCLPGVGPALAKRIVEYRQNNGGRMSVRDLLLVEGVGEKKFAALRKYF